MLAGVPQPYVSSIELRRNIVPQEDLEAVAKVLGVSSDALMEVLEVGGE